MSSIRLLRDYENPNLPLEVRLPSLARRFPCLAGAPGLDPFSPNIFYKWILSKPPGTSTWHAGHLILNLHDKGPWAPFDAVAAVTAFDEKNRTVFANWARTWQ